MRLGSEKETDDDRGLALWEGKRKRSSFPVDKQNDLDEVRIKR